MENWLAIFDVEHIYARLSLDGKTMTITYDKWKGNLQQQGEVKIALANILFTEFRQTPARGNVIIRTQGTDGKKRNYNFVFKEFGWNRPDVDPAISFHEHLFEITGC
jgi:hypothetical protein